MHDLKAVVERLRELLAKATPGPSRERGERLTLKAVHFGDSSSITPRHTADTVAVLDDGWPEHEAVTDLFVETINALPALLDALSPPQDETGGDWICSGLPDAPIEAGIAAWNAANHDMANYVAGETTDWDEGMIVAAIYKAVRNSLASTPPSRARRPIGRSGRG